MRGEQGVELLLRRLRDRGHLALTGIVDEVIEFSPAPQWLVSADRTLGDEVGKARHGGDIKLSRAMALRPSASISCDDVACLRRPQLR